MCNEVDCALSSVITNYHALHYKRLFQTRILVLKWLLKLEVFREIWRTLKFFWYTIRRKFFGITDSLSGSMQGKNVTAIHSKVAADVVCKKLVKLRTDREFDNLLWQRLKK